MFPVVCAAVATGQLGLAQPSVDRRRNRPRERGALPQAGNAGLEADSTRNVYAQQEWFN